jgi:hypothetical protein
MSSQNTENSALTPEQSSTNFTTMRHIERVRNLLNHFVRVLLERGELHDQSKLSNPEVEAFAEYTPKLAACTYGSAEYEGFRKAMSPALAHHYANNRHHPEHFKRGIRDMNLVDIVEMLCDWIAAGERHNDGNPRKSIATNRERFGMSDDLAEIMENTLEILGK